MTEHWWPRATMCKEHAQGLYTVTTMGKAQTRTSVLQAESSNQLATMLPLPWQHSCCYYCCCFWYTVYFKRYFLWWEVLIFCVTVRLLRLFVGNAHLTKQRSPIMIILWVAFVIRAMKYSAPWILASLRHSNLRPLFEVNNSSSNSSINHNTRNHLSSYR